MRHPACVVVGDDDFDKSRQDDVQEGKHDFVRVVVRLLRGRAYDVVRLHSGEEALAYAERNPRPVVLFLCNLRHFAGIRARIEMASPYESLHVILATGAMCGIPQFSRVTVLRKPFDIEMFFGVVGAAAGAVRKRELALS